MKKRLLLTAALGFGLLATPALAQVTGTVGVNASHSEIDAGAFDADDDAYGLNGAVSIPVGGSLAVLLDGSYSHADEADTDLFAGTAHLITRNDSRAFGGFIGLADVDDETAVIGGGEYAKFFSNSTLALGAGYGQLDDADVDLYGLSGEYRYFLTDNLRLDAGLGWTKADATFGDADIWTAGVGVEYRIANSPVSVGANYLRGEANDDFDVSSDVFGIFARWDFGNGSLKARDRTGNTFGQFGGVGGALSLF
jgi:hypothetical protein